MLKCLGKKDKGKSKDEKGTCLKKLAKCNNKKGHCCEEYACVHIPKKAGKPQYSKTDRCLKKVTHENKDKKDKKNNKKKNKKNKKNKKHKKHKKHKKPKHTTPQPEETTSYESGSGDVDYSGDGESSGDRDLESLDERVR